MQEDPRVTTGPDPGVRRSKLAATTATTATTAATATTGRSPFSVSLDLGEITGQILDATVPGFADAGAVFALERLMASGERGGGDGEVVVRRLGIRFAGGRIHGPDVIFPAGEVVAFGPGTPYAGCVTSGRAAVFAEPDGKTAERVASRPGGRGDPVPVLVVPGRADDQPRRPHRPPDLRADGRHPGLQ